MTGQQAAQSLPVFSVGPPQGETGPSPLLTAAVR